MIGVIDGGPIDWSSDDIAPHAPSSGVCGPALLVPLPTPPLLVPMQGPIVMFDPAQQPMPGVPSKHMDRHGRARNHLRPGD